MTRRLVTLALLPEHAELLREVVDIAAREGAHLDADERATLASMRDLLAAKLAEVQA